MLNSCSILTSVYVATKASNLILIAPLSPNENHFFLANCYIEEGAITSVISESTSNGLIVLQVKLNEFEWFDYLWNQVFNEGNKIQSFHQSQDCQSIFTRFFGLDKSVMEQIQFHFTILIKDITKLNSLVSQIQSKVEILWTDFDRYFKSNVGVKSEWQLVSIPFLNDLYFEKYPRAAYLILDEEQKKEDYYVLNQSFRSKQNLLVIDLYKDDFIRKYRIRHITLTQKHSYSFFAENEVDILEDFTAYVFENYGNWENKFDELFMIRRANYKSLLKTINNTDERYRYLWIDETIFTDTYKSSKFDLLDNSLWYQKCIYGIIVRKHDYYRRYSDFGSDNSLIVAFGDSHYPKLSRASPLHVYHYPRGYSSDGKERYVDYDMMDTNIYSHFYEGKRLLLINFDKVPYIDKVNRYYPGCIANNVEHLTALKVIRLPKFLLGDTFILTSDLWPET